MGVNGFKLGKENRSTRRSIWMKQRLEGSKAAGLHRPWAPSTFLWPLSGPGGCSRLRDPQGLTWALQAASGFACGWEAFPQGQRRKRTGGPFWWFTLVSPAGL